VGQTGSRRPLLSQRALTIRFDASLTRDFARASSREWLETNGLGGWASSTICGAHTRRYHGLLVVATRPPLGRVVLLSRLDETLILDYDRIELGCGIFPGAVHPKGYELLSSFALDPCPTWTYSSREWTLRKRLAMLDGEHALAITYELERAASPLQLELRPFFAGRDYHHLMQANDGIRRTADFADGIFSYRPYPDQPEAHILAPGSSYETDPDWYYNFQYPREEERGLDASEDLFTPGRLHVTLAPGAVWGLVTATEAPVGRDPVSLFAAETQRRLRVSLPDPLAADPLLAQLARAADQFLVRRGDGLHTILAGYHWFTDWGRDTMIALPGICLVTGRYEEAKDIFRAFAAHISQGMIPNRYPDFGEEPEYNTVDATLWFFTALYKYLQYTGDYALARELWPKLKDIVSWHQQGTRFQIRVDADGLLSGGEDGVQLTWMDAKVDDWVVTPRIGKPVEINALWYNALKTMEYLAAEFGEETDYGERAERTCAAFNAQFWNEDLGCLYDLVAPDGPDSAIRPNQLFALALPFPLIEGERARQLLKVVDEHLLTPRGLRSLSPRDPAYRAHYLGGPWERDGAYHQGIVWGWLIGPFITALVRVHGDEGRQRGRAIIAGFAEHLRETGLGSISEIFDAEPPFAPRGCAAQAWSVAELLRAGVEDVLEQGPQ
jgi:predicted glycogen debranching enzyme